MGKRKHCEGRGVIESVSAAQGADNLARKMAPRYKPLDEARRILREANWGDLVPRLTLFAVYRMLVYHIYNRDPGDFVHDAIVKTLDGKRHWREGVEPYGHLCGIIMSDVSNAAQYARRQNATLRSYAHGEAVVDVAGDGDGIAAAREVVERKMGELRGLLDDREWAVANLWMTADPPCPPRHVAEVLGWPVDQVRNVARRVRRKLCCHMAHLQLTRREPNGGPFNGPE